MEKVGTLLVHIVRAVLFLQGLVIFRRVVIDSAKVGSDFTQDYIAARALFEGSSIYGDNILRLGESLLGFVNFANYHPPFDALLFAPFAMLEYEAAFAVLSVLSLLLFYLVLFLVVRAFDLPRSFLLNGICLAPYWHPFYFCITNGQSSMLIIACLVGGWFLLRQKAATAAGILFAIATGIKLFPGFVVFYLLVNKEWRAFISMAASLLVFGIACLGIVGFADCMTYVTHIVPSDVADWKHFPLNVSLVGMTERLIGSSGAWTQPFIAAPLLARAVTLVLSGLVFIGAILGMWYGRDSEQGIDLGFSLVFVAMILLSPVSWVHIFPILLLPLGVLYPCVASDTAERSARLVRAVAICLGLTLFVSPVLWGWHLTPLVILFALAMLLFWGRRGGLSFAMLVLGFVLVSMPDLFIARLLVQFFGTPLPPGFTPLILAPGLGLLLLMAMLFHQAKQVLTSE